jgi:hypothetical protein
MTYRTAETARPIPVGCIAEGRRAADNAPINAGNPSGTVKATIATQTSPYGLGLRDDGRFVHTTAEGQFSIGLDTGRAFMTTAGITQASPVVSSDL